MKPVARILWTQSLVADQPSAIEINGEATDPERHRSERDAAIVRVSKVTSTQQATPASDTVSWKLRGGECVVDVLSAELDEAGRGVPITLLVVLGADFDGFASAVADLDRFAARNGRSLTESQRNAVREALHEAKKKHRIERGACVIWAIAMLALLLLVWWTR